MKKLLLAVFIAILVFGCTKNISDLEIDDSNMFLDVITWKVYENGRLTYYEFKEGLGVSTLKTSWLNSSATQIETKTVDAKMSEIKTGNGFMSFKINNIKYVYKP
jgi:hypothetical protein